MGKTAWESGDVADEVVLSGVEGLKTLGCEVVDMEGWKVEITLPHNSPYVLVDIVIIGSEPDIKELARGESITLNNDTIGEVDGELPDDTSSSTTSRETISITIETTRESTTKHTGGLGRPHISMADYLLRQAERDAKKSRWWRRW